MTSSSQLNMASSLRGFLELLVFLVVLGIATSSVVADGLQSELIFPKQDKHVHSSSIVELPDGGFLACWFYGSGERSANDVLIQGARLPKAARQWSSVFGMADTPNLPDCNPVLFVDGQQRLWMYWIVPLANRWEHSVLKYRRAEDYSGDGPPKWSWQDVINLVPDEAFAESMQEGFRQLQQSEGMWAEYAPPYARMLIEASRDPIKRQTGWMTRTHPVMLPSGRILVPLYSDGFNAGLMAISDDEGETWTPSAPIVGLGPIQPSVVRMKDGTLVAYLRDSGDPPGRVMRSTSQDDGQTWSIALDTDIPNPGSSLEAIALDDGRWVMVYNDSEANRGNLAIACSDDEGRTWKWKRYLEDGAKRGESYGYPSVIQASDGNLHVTYTFDTPEGKAIKHVAFSPAWITAGSSSSEE